MITLFRHIKTIYVKEMLDTVRDRKTLYVMILVPLLLMPLLMSLGPLIMERENKKLEQTIYKIALQGEENGKELAERIKQNPRLEIVNSKNPEEDLKADKIQLVVAFPPGFEQSMKNQNKAEVIIKYEGTEKVSDFAKNEVNSIINSYSKQLVKDRLALKGLSPDVLEPFAVRDENVAGDEKMGGMFLSLIIPLMLMVWITTGGVYTAIDAGAGEKERGTLEALLVTPPDRKAVVLGKYFAILTVSLVTTSLALISIFLSFQFLLPQMAMMEEEVLKVSLPLVGTAIILGVVFLLACLVCALQLALSIYARSFKEAQNYITPLYLVTMIPSFVVQSISTSDLPDYLFVVPFINALLVFKELFIGEIYWVHVGLVVVSTLVLTILALGFVFSIFNKEKVLFRT